MRRVSIIANQTLRFYRQTTKAMPVVVRELIDTTLSLYQGRLVNSKICVERQDRGDSTVTCFDGEIRQVLSNFVANAIDALGATGERLLIRSREGAHWKTGRKGMVITVADTGSGMTHDTLSRIFEPFFTTKGISGTGLGLWISHEIIGRHQGVLTVRSSQSESSHGTVITLFLPHKL